MPSAPPIPGAEGGMAPGGPPAIGIPGLPMGGPAFLTAMGGPAFFAAGGAAFFMGGAALPRAGGADLAVVAEAFAAGFEDFDGGAFLPYCTGGLL